MIRRALIALVVLAAIMAQPAVAEAYTDYASQFAESPRTIALEVRLGWYLPDIDSEFGGASTPYQDVFGSESLFMYGLSIDYLLYKDFGALSVGGGLAFGWVDGKGLLSDGTQSEEETSFNMLPFSLGVQYAFDYLTRYKVPLVPYVKANLIYALWWFDDGAGETAEATSGDDTYEAFGGTFGYSLAAGMKLLLDVFMPGMAQSFDVDMGVNNSYLFVELDYSVIDDFGSDESIVLDDTTVTFGIAFDF